MATKIKERPLNICPKECRCGELTVESTPLYADGKHLEIINTLRCEHEKYALCGRCIVN